MQIDVARFAVGVEDLIAQRLQQQLQALRGIETACEERCELVQGIEHLQNLVRDGREDRVLRIVTAEAPRGEDLAKKIRERDAEVAAIERFDDPIHPRERGRHGTGPFRIAEHTRRELQRIIERVRQ